MSLDGASQGINNGGSRIPQERSAIDDLASPYFMHHSDNPGLVLVSQPLTGENYTSWSRAMLIALSVKNKTCFVDGSLPKPEGTNLDQLNSWIRSNNIVISWILNSVSKEISASVIYADTAHEIWMDLRDRFQQKNGPRIFQLRRELMNLVQKEDSVGNYFTKLKIIWEELNNYRPVCSCSKCSCGGHKEMIVYHQMEYVMSFLMGLNDSFSQIRGQILLMDPLPPINKVFALVSQEEHQRKIGFHGSSSVDTGIAFAVKDGSMKRNDRAGPGTSTQMKAGMGNSKSQRKDRPFCTHCNTAGHTIERCYKLHGYPPGYKMRSKEQSNGGGPVNQISAPLYSNNQSIDNSSCTSDQSSGNFFQNLSTTQYNQLMSMFKSHLTMTTPDASVAANAIAGTCLSVSQFSVATSKKIWILDSGATRHICSNMDAFSKLRPVSNTSVTLPNSARICVGFSGDVMLSPSLILKDVLFVPQFNFNLISISCLINDNLMPRIMVTFLDDKFILQDAATKRMIGKGNKHEGLYVLNTDSSFDLCSVLINQVSTRIWHNRLGHLSFKRLECLQGQLNCDASTMNKVGPCYVCPLAKQRRLSFVAHNNMAENAFDVIHCDIWGPHHIASYTNHRYFLTLVDDFSRFTWVYLLQHKSDVATVIPRFCTMIETQFGICVKKFRSDNAPELSLTDFFHKRGMLHDFSCVERPEQNSVVERKHQHLLNVARALYFQSRIPIQFWTDCVLTATFLINRTPTPLLRHQTPHDVLLRKPPDYSRLRVFGCLAFASTLMAQRTKFTPRARVCVFLGYPPGVKGYKLYDIETKQVFISRDVVFHEEIFPFHTVRPSASVLDPFPDLVLPIPQADLDMPSTSQPSHDQQQLQDSSPHDSMPGPSTIVPHESANLRRSNRIAHPPSYLREFHCSLVTQQQLPNTTSKYPLSQYLSYDSLSPSHRSFVLAVSSNIEPRFYHEAVRSEEWRKAMAAELQAMEDNNTWSIVPLPPNKNAIGCKWVYKLKFRSDGSLERHKARLVAKGYTQQEGLDFFDTYSPVAKLPTVKVLLALAASQQWNLVQLDVNNAFLNGDLFEEVYMDLPLGYRSQGEFPGQKLV